MKVHVFNDDDPRSADRFSDHVSPEKGTLVASSDVKMAMLDATNFQVSVGVCHG